MSNDIRQLSTFHISGDLLLYGPLNSIMPLIVKYLLLSIAWCRASIRRDYLQRNNRLVAIELRLTCAHIYLQSDNTRHRVTRRWYAGWRRYAVDH